MNSTPPPLTRVAPSFVLFAALLLAAGCASDDGRPPRGANKHREHFPTMAGHETFFKGTITAEVLVGAMTGFDPQTSGGGNGDGGGKHHGGGMRMRGGGGGGMGGGGGGMGGHGSRHGGGEMPSDGDDDAAGRQQAMALRRADNMGSPPVMIHLRFVNHGAEKAEVVIADFLSPLGNFVVQPEKFSLDPGQALAAEPMTSRLAGEISSGEITLSLRLAGTTETKTIALELQPEPPAPPPETEPAK